MSLMNLPNSPDQPSECGTLSEVSQDSKYETDDVEAEVDDVEANYDEPEADDVDPFCCVDSDQDDGDYKVNPVLMNDIRLLKENCPRSSCSYRILDIINEMEIDISFPTTTLQRKTAEAWGLGYGEPVVVRLSVNVTSYLDSPGVFKVELPLNGHAPGVLMQLKRIVQEFCSRQFQELSNEKVQEAVKNNSNDLSVFQECSESGDTENDAEKTNSDKPSALTQLKKIVQEFCSRQFWELRNEKVQEAVKNKSADLSLCQESAESVDTTNDAEVGTNRDKLSPMETGVDSRLLETTANTPLNPENAKDTPSLSHGFLVQLFLYVERRLLTLNSFCPVCDSCHSTVVRMMLKPVICCNPLCTFAYHTLGVMAGAADSIVSEPQVVQLLIYLTKAACESSRKGVIFSPYPTIVDPTNEKELAIHPENKDYNLLNEILGKIPNVPEMLKYDETKLKIILQEKHVLCEPLLRWIISSNRAHIVKLPANKQLSFMGTRHQFLMRISPPLQDREFRMKKEKYGSVFAFHGSPIENWHCIIREGLVVASCTNKMINGADYGRGIYISPHLGTSILYCSHFDKITGYPVEKKAKKAQGAATPGFIHGVPDNLVCIALCEIINCSSLKKLENSRELEWIMKESENVCTRFFFVYDECNPTSRAYHSTMTTTPAIQKEIEMILAAEG
ncbi:hypothetical protein BsWGS_01895 [Bradybaena similaris]